MEKKISNKLHGFILAPNDRFTLLTFGILNPTEFILYEFYITLTDWDLRHERYGRINVTNKEVASWLGFNTSTITRTRNKLITKQWLSIYADGSLEAKDYQKWTNNYWKKFRESGEKMHRAYANLHLQSAVVHQFKSKFVSYKESVNRDEDLPRVINTEQEFIRTVEIIFLKDYLPTP